MNANNREKSNVLVVGASGSFGRAVAKELVRRGHRVRATVRPGGRPVAIAGVEAVEADATDRDSLARAARGVDVLVYGFNVPYPRWEKELLPAARVLAEVATECGALIVLPGNVYGLGPDFEKPLDERCDRVAPSRKGELRNQMEALLHEATGRGARLLIVRAGDYFGPEAVSTSWFNFVTAWGRKGGPLLKPDPGNVLHAWAYLPDLARATSDLIERRRQLAASEVFHFAGHTVDGDTLFDSVRAALGDPERSAVRVPWALLWVLGFVVPMIREILDMRYLWKQPLRLDQGKLEGVLERVPHTPLDEAVRSSLAGLSGAITPEADLALYTGDGSQMDSP